MAIEHPHVSLIAPAVHRDPETLDVIETPVRETGPNFSSGYPDFSDANIQTLRADIEKYNKHLPPDQLAAKLAAFDKDAANAGIEIQPIDHALVARLKDADLSPDPKPSDYKVDYGKLARDLHVDNLNAVSQVTTGWAADLGLSPSIGSSIIEQIIRVGEIQKNATPDERQRWKDQQESLGLKITGSKAALVELRQRAESVLSMASSNPFTRTIRDSLVMSDFQVLSLLATHADILKELEISLADK